MRELERDIFKIALVGIFAVVAVKGLNNSGGVAQIAKALIGGYNETLGTIAKT